MPLNKPLLLTLPSVALRATELLAAERQSVGPTSGVHMKPEIAKKMLEAACNLQGASVAARKIAREQFRRAETNQENILRINIDGQVGLLVGILTKRIENSTPEISYQLSLSASFVRSHYIIGDMILDGDIVEAMTLLRKQIEIVSRLNETDSKPMADLLGKVPNIKNGFGKTAGRTYGELSEIAHFASPHVGELLHTTEAGDRVGPSLLPQYSKAAGGAMDLHHYVAIYFLGYMIEKLSAWYSGFDANEMREILGSTILLALETGTIRQASDQNPVSRK